MVPSGPLAAAANQRENPNSTNPFFANKARSPDKSNRAGFAKNNEIRRTPDPMIRLDKTPSGDKDDEDIEGMKQPPLQKVRSYLHPYFSNQVILTL